MGLVAVRKELDIAQEHHVQAHHQVVDAAQQDILVGKVVLSELVTKDVLLALEHAILSDQQLFLETTINIQKNLHLHVVLMITNVLIGLKTIGGMELRQLVGMMKEIRLEQLDLMVFPLCQTKIRMPIILS
jgi:hypothetical protein